MDLIPFLSELEKIGFGYTKATGYQRSVLTEYVKQNDSQFKSPFSFIEQFLTIDVDKFNNCTMRLMEKTQWEGNLGGLLMGHSFKIDEKDTIKELNKKLIQELHSHDKFKHEFRKYKIEKILKDNE